MTFNPKYVTRSGPVTDRRGMRGVPGGLADRRRRPRHRAPDRYLLLGGDPSALGPVLEPGAVDGPGSSQLATDCKTGAGRQRARRLPDPRLREQHPGVLERTFAAAGETYQPVDTVLFSGATSTGCGTARAAATGPFYCPPDQLVYLDLDFFEELRSRFGAQGGLARQGYVIAHEYGHHVQDLLGALQGAASSQGAESRLRPDRAAGRLLRRRLGEPRREHRLPQPSPTQQIADALDAAAAVGDDRIQEAHERRGRSRLLDPRLVGSSASSWFSTGYQAGDPAGCDTFKAPRSDQSPAAAHVD